MQTEQTKKYLRELRDDGKYYLRIHLESLDIEAHDDWTDEELDAAIDAEIQGAYGNHGSLVCSHTEVTELEENDAQT